MAPELGKKVIKVTIDWNSKKQLFFAKGRGIGASIEDSDYNALYKAIKGSEDDNLVFSITNTKKTNEQIRLNNRGS